MSRKKNFDSMGEARRILGADFFEAVSELMPLVGPRIDMVRGDQEVLIVVELPGLVSQDDVILSLDGYNLTIEGDLKRPYVIDEDKLIVNERSGGMFKRKVKIPSECTINRVEADYFNGLLFIKIPVMLRQASQVQERIQIKFHG
ncbi:MAG TPA: Hsp20/alpha crystallin family protein [Bacillus bacterium]|nr:Hsp20/alpha crystallin family protein [Bacillus sp. (in: firmicutes)]